MTRRLLALVALLALLVAACSSTDAEDGASGDGAADEAAAAAAADQAEVESRVGDVEWVRHEADPECLCADGSDFDYFTKTQDPQRVVLYFQGGGACFSEETCSFDDGTYFSSLLTYGVTGDADDESSVDEDGRRRLPSGIFDFSNEDNPFRDWSFVFVPYCTGDVHIGENVTAYGDDLSVNHVGYPNASHGLDEVVENFGDATEVFVTGSSAGGVPAPLFGGLVSDALPEAEVTVLADASGGYPDAPALNAGIGGLWGTFENVPDWDSTAGITVEEWSIPGMFTRAGLHEPEIRMARVDHAYDRVQAEFTDLAGAESGDVLAVLDANEATVEASGVPLSTFIFPGNDHTILGRDDLYSIEVEGVSFLDWLNRYVDGDVVEDVRCVDCGSPAPRADEEDETE